MKSIFHHFKGLSNAKNCLRPESAPLKISKAIFGAKFNNKTLSEIHYRNYKILINRDHKELKS